MSGAAAGLSLRRRCIFWDVVKGSITHLSTRLHVCHVNIRIDSMSIASHRVAPTAAYNAMPRHFLPHHTAAYMPSHYDDPAMRGTAAYDAMDPFATTRSMPPNYVNPHYGYEPLSHAEPMRTSAMPTAMGCSACGPPRPCLLPPGAPRLFRIRRTGSRCGPPRLLPRRMATARGPPPQCPSLRATELGPLRLCRMQAACARPPARCPAPSLSAKPRFDYQFH